MCLGYRVSFRFWVYYGYSIVFGVRFFLIECLSLLFLKCYMWFCREDCMVGKINLLMDLYVFKKVEYNLYL